ncbi:MAG: HIT family protein [Candidatus Berkelbacteria bacterium]|nr:HIT family protein [Candidatus Berkelbacteria bacterium]
MPDFAPYDKYRVFDFEHWVLFLNIGQQYLGRCYLALKRDGAIDIFEDTKPCELAELLRAVATIKKAMAELFGPDKYDYCSLGNEWHHCHLHLIPRYQSERQFFGFTFIDQCWGRNYALYDRNITFPNELLFQLCDALRKALSARLLSDLHPHPRD